MDHIERWLFVCQESLHGTLLNPQRNERSTVFNYRPTHFVKMEDWTSDSYRSHQFQYFFLMHSYRVFFRELLVCLKISRGHMSLTTVSLPLTALGQYIEQIASSGCNHFRYLLQIYYCDQSTEDLVLAKALATGVLWRLLVMVRRSYNWLFPCELVVMSNEPTLLHTMCTSNQCQKSCTKLCFCLVDSLSKIFSGHFQVCPAVPESHPKSFLPAWWQLALVCAVVFVGVLNRMLLNVQCCELLKSNELTRVQKPGDLRKHLWKLIRLAQLASPIAFVVAWDRETGTGKE